jgi:signal transduction histidine kinase
MQAEICTDLAELIVGLEAGAGAVLLAEEALFGKSFATQGAWVEQQPPWSELPFVLLTSNQQQSSVAAWRRRLITSLRNVTLLERPLQSIALTSSVLSAVKACGRQYEVRAYIAAREEAAHALEGLIAARTSELAEANIQLRAQIAQRENVEASLRQSQKMEAVGQLTGGIAHDFNNMLQSISGGLELMHRRIHQGRAAEAARYVDSARKAVGRATALTNRLLAFARRQTLQPRPVDLDGLIVGMEELIRHTAGLGITVELSLDNEFWSVLCDPNQLENAVLNVAINARDAMPEGGRLTISTRPMTLRETDLAGQDGAEPGDYVEIALTDTGTGMDETTQARVFEPFFTTKPTGQGTGLGLSQLYGFVRQSGGLVRLESKLGQGTTVRLYLPRHGKAAAEAVRQAQDVEPEKATALGVVLLVEDEAEVRAMAVDWLREVGYQVLEAEDGPTALGLLARTSHVDLLVTDVGLPNGLNGRQVADAARERRQGLPVLFITGYSGPMTDQLSPGMQVIGKPFTLDALGARIGAILEKHAKGRAS